MTWRTRMQPASFRGAGFLVEGHDGEVGRRLAVHEYPQRDLPYAEDLGRKARVFKITGLVIGPDYMAARDALLAACEQPGPGTLVHPYHGTMEVVCQACTYREETRAGGRASFSFTFMEAGQRNYPAVELDFTAQAAEAGENVRAVAGEVFAQVYQTAGPAWLAAALTGDFRTALQLVQAVARNMPSILDGSAVNRFLADLEATAASVEALVAGGALAVAEALAETVTGLATAGGSAATDGLLDLAAFGAPNASNTHGLGLTAVPATTAHRRAQAANQDALAALTRRLAISGGVEAALAADYLSHEAATARRDSLLANLDQQMLAAGDAGQDDAYQALRGLYVSTNQAFAAKAVGLAHVRHLALPPATRPALVLAYDLYGDLGRTGQIVAMNNLPHPGLPPAGESLQVLDG
ncbi:MAG: DNA circularization N-terminal domain-containing protein [Desulfarculus sp.]|nr:DNA circularization N-terminal domain-containing protein [Desulfarculus sp.]